MSPKKGKGDRARKAIRKIVDIELDPHGCALSEELAGGGYGFVFERLDW